MYCRCGEWVCMYCRSVGINVLQLRTSHVHSDPIYRTLATHSNARRCKTMQYLHFLPLHSHYRSHPTPVDPSPLSEERCLCHPICEHGIRPETHLIVQPTRALARTRNSRYHGKKPSKLLPPRYVPPAKHQSARFRTDVKVHSRLATPLLTSFFSLARPRASRCSGSSSPCRAAAVT